MSGKAQSLQVTMSYPIHWYAHQNVRSGDIKSDAFRIRFSDVGVEMIRTYPFQSDGQAMVSISLDGSCDEIVPSPIEQLLWEVDQLWESRGGYFLYCLRSATDAAGLPLCSDLTDGDLEGTIVNCTFELNARTLEAMSIQFWVSQDLRPAGQDSNHIDLPFDTNIDVLAAAIKVGMK